MTPFLTQLEEQLRVAAQREVASGRRRSGLLGAHRFWSAARLLPAFTVAALAVAVFVFAIVSGHRGSARHVASAPTTTLPMGSSVGPAHAAGTGSPIISSIKLAAEAPDPRGGLDWGLRTFRTGNGQTCMLVGRTQDGLVGEIGEDGTAHNDGAFHPLTAASFSGYCGQTDGRGNAFLDVSATAVPASGADPSAGPPTCKLPGVAGTHLPACPSADVRDVQFGLLGPDATSVTYRTAAGGLTTVPTGSGGAYLAAWPQYRSGFGGVSSFLGGGRIVAIHYRSGAVCRPTGRHRCNPVGYLAPRAPRVTDAKIASPITARILRGKHYCGNNVGFYVVCDGRVPRGFQRLPGAGGQLLLQFSWIARVAARGPNYGYEFDIVGGPPCGGGESSSSVIDARAGQRVVEQSLGSSGCAQRDKITVEYRTNVGPGGVDFANPVSPGPDGQPLVGSTTIWVPKR